MPQNRLNQEEQQEYAEDNPALNNVIERNIRTSIDLRQQAARRRSLQDRLADAITSVSGRMVRPSEVSRDDLGAKPTNIDKKLSILELR